MTYTILLKNCLFTYTLKNKSNTFLQHHLCCSDQVLFKASICFSKSAPFTRSSYCGKNRFETYFKIKEKYFFQSFATKRFYNIHHHSHCDNKLIFNIVL